MTDLCNWPTCGCHTINGSPWCKASFTAAPVDQITVTMALPAVRALVAAASAIKQRRENGDSGSVNSAIAVDNLIAAIAPFGKATE